MSKSFINLSKNTYVLICILLCSFLVLLLISPTISVFLLLVPTVYFLSKGNYKNVFIIWDYFFLFWYFAFTACLIGYDYPISIGHVECGGALEETNRLFFYISDNYSSQSLSSTWSSCLFERFCLETFMLLYFLSSKLGVPIWIPSLLKEFIKFLFKTK